MAARQGAKDGLSTTRGHSSTGMPMYMPSWGVPTSAPDISISASQLAYRLCNTSSSSSSSSKALDEYGISASRLAFIHHKQQQQQQQSK
jgi:hypothetical protein